MTDAPPPFEGLVQSIKIQAAACGRMGSPFSRSLLDAAGHDVQAGGVTRTVLERWVETPARAAFADAAALRLLGAFHDLALSGEDRALTAAYPKPESSGDPEAAWSAALRAMATDPERFVRFTAHEPQTNEVGRSACLLPGFLALSASTRLPLRIFELGASAGLNQLWDRYDYRLVGVGEWGPGKSPVRIATEWRGGPPPLGAIVAVTERAACDRNPVVLTAAAARRRLRAYVWADQIERLQRLNAAINVARSAEIVVESADAVEWTRDRVKPCSGAVTALFHSVFWQYMPPESQEALANLILELGSRATAEAPFAWLRMEPSADVATMELRLTVWPQGDDRLLATVHPHGAWVNWEAA